MCAASRRNPSSVSWRSSEISMFNQESAMPQLRVIEDPRQGCVWEVFTPGTRARFTCGNQAHEHLRELMALHLNQFER